MNDDLTTLRLGWGPVEPPSPGARDRARTTLMDSMKAAPAVTAPAEPGLLPRPGLALQPLIRRWLPGLVTAGVASVVVVAFTVGALHLGRGGDVPVTQSAPTAAPTSTGPTSPAEPIVRAFELAARYVSAQPFTAPRPDQWIYIEVKQILSPNIADTKGTAREKTVQLWKRADGVKEALYIGGTLRVQDYHTGSGMVRDYPTLAGLPTDPNALLGWVRSHIGVTNDDGTAFVALTTIASQNLLPPDVAAAVLRAAALIPGVTERAVAEPVDGHAVTALGRLLDDWRQADILLDSQTHAVVGVRNVAAVDYVDPDGHFRFDQGDFVDMVIMKAAVIVDAPGQTS